MKPDMSFVYSFRPLQLLKRNKIRDNTSHVKETKKTLDFRFPRMYEVSKVPIISFI